MAIEKRTKIDRIEITENGSIQIREKSEIFEDDIPLGSPTFHRTTIDPGGQIPEGMNTDFDLQKVASGAWTEKVLADHQAQLDAQLQAFNKQQKADAQREAEQAKQQPATAADIDAIVERKVKAALAKLK